MKFFLRFTSQGLTIAFIEVQREDFNKLINAGCVSVDFSGFSEIKIERNPSAF